MLECFDRILIPACTHLTMGLKQKQPALMAVLMQACVHALLHVPRLSPHPAHRFVMSRRPRQVGACRVFFSPKVEACLQRPGHVSWSRPHFSVSYGQPSSREVKAGCCQKATQPSKPTLEEAVSKPTAAFFPHPQMRNLLLSPPRLCSLFTKDHLMEQPHAGPARLSLTSIKANKT